MAKQIKRLYRAPEKDSVLGGVCAGIANYFEIDPVIVRFGWVIASLLSFGLGVIAYLIAWIIIPRKK
jgi:phage shock protein PspC (stress-responsive transcriptional regulator)